MSLNVSNSGSNAQGESRALEGRCSSQKVLQGSETETRGLLGEYHRGDILPFVVVAKKHCAEILATVRALLYRGN